MSREVSVVACSTLGLAEDVVCFVDADETVGGGRVAAIVIWVVTFGEVVELTVNLLSLCCKIVIVDDQILEDEGMLERGIV